MTGTDLLTWARGPGWELALLIFVCGLVLRGVEILALGRRPDLAPPRPPERQGSALKTVGGRFLPYPGLLARLPLVHVGGYLFHVGFFLVLLCAEAHARLFSHLFNLTWPTLPAPLIDALTVITLAAAVALYVSRWRNPVRRLLTGAGDHLAWGLAFLPLFTGWLAYHHLLLPYPLMAGLHMLSAELLLAALPFTNLIHAVTIFGARGLTGHAYARKGVQV